MAGKIIRHPQILEQSKNEVRRQVGQLHLVPTTGPEVAGTLARECAAKGADVILVAGGDGTLNEVLNGMTGCQIPVGVMPGGTANVFAMETGLRGNMLRVAKSLSSLVPVEVPLGVLRRPGAPPRHFLLMGGVGLDATIVEKVSTPLKRRLGKVAYWLGGFSAVGQKLPEFRVVIDGNGTEYRSSFVLASRVKNYGGDLEIARHANLLKPELAVVLFEGSNSLRYLKYFAGVMVNRLDGMAGVRVIRCQSLALEPEEQRIAVQIDGESAGQLPVELAVSDQRVTMLLPQDFLTKNSPASR